MSQSSLKRDRAVEQFDKPAFNMTYQEFLRQLQVDTEQTPMEIQKVYDMFNHINGNIERLIGQLKIDAQKTRNEYDQKTSELNDDLEGTKIS